MTFDEAEEKVGLRGRVMFDHSAIGMCPSRVVGGLDLVLEGELWPLSYEDDIGSSNERNISSNAIDEMSHAGPEWIHARTFTTKAAH